MENLTMRKFLLKIRYWLIPESSRREQLYHGIRLVYQHAQISGKRTWIKILPTLKRTSAIPAPAIPTQDQELNTYRRWIREHEPGKTELEAQKKHQADFNHRPLISILIPINNADKVTLTDTITSVQGQTYPRWELCTTYSLSEAKPVVELLEKTSRRESRMLIKQLAPHEQIANGLNNLLDIGQGDFVLIIEPGGQLAPDSLYAIVNQLNQDPSVDMLYFDEDTISADGNLRHSPWFKPSALSPDLLLSVNYLRHAVIRRDLLKEAGNFDASMNSAQEWDLAFRLVEHNARIVHLHRVFYHNRQIPRSNKNKIADMSWESSAYKRCIHVHTQRLGYPEASIELPSPDTVHVHWPVSGKKVSIIIPTKDNVGLLRACLDSIFEKTRYPDFEIILVDTGSIEAATKQYYDTLALKPGVRVISDPSPFNFQKVCNLGASYADGDVFVFLNNDTEALDPEWLDELVGWAERPEIGIVGARLTRPDHTIQHAGLVIGLAGHGSHVFDGGAENQCGPFGSSEWYRDYQAVTGACLAIRRQVFAQLGGFDEVYRVGYGDIDLCLRVIDAGYRVVYNPFARLLHHEGATRGLTQPPSDVLRASVRMYHRIQSGDPFFSSNLSHYQRVPTIIHEHEPPISELILRIMQDFDLISRDDLDAVEPLRWDVQIPQPANDSIDNKKMLVVSHELTRSGAPIILWQICAALARKGIQITVLSPEDGPLHQEYLHIGVSVHILPSLLKDARIVLPYLQGQDLVLLNTILCYRVAHAVKASNLPLLFWVHESTFGHQICRANPGAKSAIAITDRLIFPSHATSRLYLEFGPSENHRVIHSGINITPLQPDDVKPPFKRKPDRLYVVVVASIESRKGQDVLLQAFKMLPADISDQVECFLIGRKLDLEFSQNVVKNAKTMGNVHIVGETPANLVMQYLAVADVFILPSRDEALPISLIEAMAFGLAIIATRVGGVTEIIQDQVNGLLVEKEDPAGLAKCITRLYLDKDYRYNLGQAGKHSYQENLTFDKFVERYYTVISELESFYGEKN
jgi:glycosyltransferase involved in cell wall biosynthesis